MEEQSTLNTQLPTTKPKRNWKKIILYTAIALVLVAASSIATYLWQQQTVASLNKQLTAQQEKLTFVEKERDGLDEQITELSEMNDELLNPSSPSGTPTPHNEETIAEDTLDISVLGARKYVNPSNTSDTRNVAVDLSITNSSAKNLNFSLLDFRLIDNHSNVSGSSGGYAGKTMSNGLVVLDNQVVAPGQTIKGVMVFASLHEPAGAFTLTYKGEGITVTLE